MPVNLSSGCSTQFDRFTCIFGGRGGWVEGPAGRPVRPTASVGGWVVDRFGQVWSQPYQIVESKKFCVQNDISKPITGLWLLLLSLLDILVALMALSPTFSGQNYFSGKPASESISCENFYRSPVSGFETKSRIQKYTAHWAVSQQECRLYRAVTPAGRPGRTRPGSPRRPAVRWRPSQTCTVFLMRLAGGRLGVAGGVCGEISLQGRAGWRHHQFNLPSHPLYRGVVIHQALGFQ